MLEYHFIWIPRIRLKVVVWDFAPTADRVSEATIREHLEARKSTRTRE
jgi:hypothetical protein